MERALFGGSTGAIYALLRRASLSACLLSLKRSSVPGLVSGAEYDQLRAELETSLPLESRVKQVSLIARNVAVTAARAHGRGERSLKFFRALSQPLPRCACRTDPLPTFADPRALIPPPLRHATRAKRLWEIEAEREADAERNEVDLALEQEYEEELELETSLEAELHQMVGFEEDAEDEQKASFTLSPVPPALQQEYKTYTVCHPTHPHPPSPAPSLSPPAPPQDYRMEPLNRMRDGSCVVTLTACNDTGICSRFLGWLKGAHDVPPSLAAVFGDARLGEWAEGWVKMLRNERSLKWSTLANYANGLFNIVSYVFTTVEVSEAALEADAPSQLLRMRAQAEKLAAQDRLFARKDPNWIDWPQLQAGRIKCLATWDASAKKPFAERKKLLRELCVMLFFSVQPPDRGALP